MIRQASRTLIYGSLARYVYVGIVAIYTIGCARYLVPESRGQMVLLVQVGYLSGSVFIAGRERAILAGYSSFKLPGPLLRATLWSMTLISCGAVFVSMPAALFAVLAIPALIASVLYPRLLEAELIRRRWSSALLVVRAGPALSLVGCFALLAFTGSQDWRTWTTCFSFSLLAPTLLLFSRLPVSPTSEGVRAAPGEIGQLALGDAGIAVAQRLDRVVLGGYGQTEVLGSYTVFATIAELAIVPMTLATQLSSNKHGEGLSPLFGRILAFFGTLSVLVLFFTGPQILSKAIGPDYHIRQSVWAWLCAAACIISLYRHLTSVALRRRKIALVSVADVGIGCSSALFYVLLIHPLGDLGAAIGSCCGYCLGVLFLGVALRRATEA